MYSYSGKILWFCHVTAILAVVSVVVALDSTTANDVASPPPAPQAVKDATPLDMTISTRNVESSNSFVTMCPNMVHYVFESAMPRDEAKAGIFEEYPASAAEAVSSGAAAAAEEVDLRSCLSACCEKNSTCNVVFIFKRKCYHVRCVSNEACLPKERAEVKDRLQMILVNPVRQRQQLQQQQHGAEDENVSWMDVLKSTKTDLFPLDELSSGNMNPLSFWKQPHKFHYTPARNQESATYDEDDFPVAEKRVNQLLMSSAADDGDNTLTPEDIAFYTSNMQASDAAPLGKYMTCDIDLPDLDTRRCPLKEECVLLRANSATGICKCMRGYVRNQLRECVPQVLDYQLLEDSSTQHAAASEVLPISETIKEVSQQQMKPEKPEIKKIVVSVVSKEVRLPEKEVTLAAFTVPDEQSSDTTYKYLWTLITQPKGPMNGTISDQSKSKVKLSNLSEGLYTFKVSVTGANGTSGEATANVTVLPEKRINRVPQVIITPSEQTIRQPTTNAILDGSTSTDDDKITSWHWEVVSGPIGYQPKLPEVNTLQLTDLTSPGNYTFKLTVSDSDNVTNSTTATITVLKGTDYPPVANAGDAVILYLPNNNVTLNGTASSDDHDIVAWEWTKDASDETKAVDMQNTRTPYVQLSNLEEGMYTFVLKVTDGSGQSSVAKVHVFVKPPTNSPPIAVAGGNMTTNLPQNWMLLNGSRSSDDIGIETYCWQQITGPNTASIIAANASVANATALTLGLYEFKLTVTDKNKNNASDTMWVKITQEKNAPPIANAGGDQSVTLPVSALYLNGSKSSDDLAIAKYIWTRDDTSLAAGLVIGDTDKRPVLILTNLVHGRYVFKLTVSDEQGLTSSDTVSIIVHPDPMLMHLVQLTLPMGVSVLTHSELNSIVQKIGLLLGDLKINVRELNYDSRSEETILSFFVESVGSDGQTTAVDGLAVEQMLKDKLQRDASILGTVFPDVRTTVCQNKCSGHGVCNAGTRACICEVFWMPSAAYFWGLDEANCDWSILYVFVGVIVTFLLLSGIFWSIACACRRQPSATSKKPRSRPKVQKYSLIGTQDEEAPHFCRTTSLTDSETDSDVLFETRTKPNGILRLNGSAAKTKQSHGQNNKYASTKIGRKIKT